MRPSVLGADAESPEADGAGIAEDTQPVRRELARGHIAAIAGRCAGPVPRALEEPYAVRAGEENRVVDDRDAGAATETTIEADARRVARERRVLEVVDEIVGVGDRLAMDE